MFKRVSSIMKDEKEVLLHEEVLLVWSYCCMLCGETKVRKFLQEPALRLNRLAGFF